MTKILRNRNKKGVYFNNTITVDPGEPLQAAIDAAVAEGAYYDNPWYIHLPDSYVDIDYSVARDKSGNLLTSDLFPAIGVKLVYPTPNIIGDAPPPVLVGAMPIAINTDDGCANWAREETGYVLSKCDAIGGATGWVDFTGPNSMKAVAAAANPTFLACMSNNAYINFKDTSSAGTALATIACSKTLNSAGTGYAAVDLTTYNSAVFTIRWFGLKPTALKFGVSTGTDFAAPILTDVPISGDESFYRVSVALTTAQKIGGVQSFGFQAAYAAGTADVRIYIDDVKVCYFGDTEIRLLTETITMLQNIPLTLATPSGYAASKGVPMTHFVVKDYIGTSGYLTVDEIRRLAFCYGNSIQAHSWSHTGAVGELHTLTDSEYLLDTVGIIEYLERLSATTALPGTGGSTAMGLKISGYKQSGVQTGVGDIHSFDKTQTIYANNIRRYFKWAMAYANGYASPLRRWFGRCLYADTAVAADVVNSGVLTLHDIDSVGANANVTYLEFKTLVDALAVRIAAGSLVCLTLPAFFDSALVAGYADGLAPGGDFAGLSTADLNSTYKNNWGYLTQSTSSIAGSPKYIKLGGSDNTAVQSVNYYLYSFIPGEPICLIINLTGEADTSILQVTAAFDNANNTNHIPVTTFRPTTDAKNYYIHLYPPVWSSNTDGMGGITLKFTRPVGMTKYITINSLKIRQRA